MGLDTAYSTSQEREDKVVKWLDRIADDAENLFLVGDIFDYWYEYKQTIPKGYSRFWSRIVLLREKGVNIHFFMGNHDMWVYDYFEKEMGIAVHANELVASLYGHNYFMAHGDGLGPGDLSYKFVKKVLRHPILQTIYGAIPSSWGLSLMKWVSKKERKYPGIQEPFTDEKKERLLQFCHDYAQKDASIDYFVFGHRHLPIQYSITNAKAKYFNLGEWMYACSYGVADNEGLKIEFFESDYTDIMRN